MTILTEKERLAAAYAAIMDVLEYYRVEYAHDEDFEVDAYLRVVESDEDSPRTHLVN